jgi:hypothetical protein
MTLRLSAALGESMDPEALRAARGVGRRSRVPTQWASDLRAPLRRGGNARNSRNSLAER